MTVPIQHILIFSTLLFLTGLYGAITRRNMVGILMSIEIMLNAVNINFIAFSRLLDVSPEVAQVFVIFIIVLAAATAAELGGAALTFAYTIESSAIIIVSFLLTRDLSIVQRFGWLFLGPIILSAESIVSRSWENGFLHNDFFVLLVLALVLMITGAFLFLDKKEGGSEDEVNMPTILVVVGATYLALLVWLTLHSVLIQDVATMVSLTIYTIVGLVLFIRSGVTNSVTLRFGGIALLGFVVFRLLIVEVWQMELTGRIITFFVIGLLLISTAFMGRKKKLEHLVEDQNSEHLS